MKAVIDAIANGVYKHREFDASMSPAQQKFFGIPDMDRAQLAISVLYSVLKLMFPVAPDAGLITLTQAKEFLSACGFNDEFIDRFYSVNAEDDPWTVY
ncbi:hypothetical protein UFOVP1130_2 [uncultured Caudovirales phage]|uniref:Uncharacterized protein n=1 Tax=uncultured Caudovirales phage TaxID=2100421 RepID=A0A6J5QKK9_9CAUD|nr:hypothetical protein UFOVP1130_2 [uncultured Caudovirales phage]